MNSAELSSGPGGSPWKLGVTQSKQQGSAVAHPSTTTLHSHASRGITDAFILHGPTVLIDRLLLSAALLYRPSTPEACLAFLPGHPNTSLARLTAHSIVPYYFNKHYKVLERFRHSGAWRRFDLGVDRGRSVGVAVEAGPAPPGRIQPREHQVSGWTSSLCPCSLQCLPQGNATCPVDSGHGRCGDAVMVWEPRLVGMCPTASRGEWRPEEAVDTATPAAFRTCGHPF